MLFSGLFGFSQKNSVETISENVSSYEFSNVRDKIYFVKNKNELFVYDTENKNLKQIQLKLKQNNPKKETLYHLILSLKDTLYVLGSNYIYAVYKDEMVDTIPFFHNIQEISGKIDENTWSSKANRINNFITDSENLKVEKLSRYYIVTKKNGRKIAADLTEFNYADKELKKTFMESVSWIKTRYNEEYSRKNIGSKITVNYFGKSDIVVEEKNYGRERFRGLMVFTSPNYKNKMKIKCRNKSYILKDKIRRSRFITRGWGKGEWNCNLYERIPYSMYITDKNDDIFLLFYNTKSKYKTYNLIRVRL